MNQLNQQKMEKNLKERWQGKTPQFWKKVQRYAIVAGTIAGSIIAAPVALPAVIVAIAGYVATAGAVAATLSQLTIDNNTQEDEQESI
jgi:Sec-independent protein secretion pathway component TatC